MLPFSNSAAEECQNIRNNVCNHELDASQSRLPLFLTRKEIVSLLNINEKNAIKLLSQHGVSPIDLGRGRGNGLRWLTSAVMKVADILHTEAQAIKVERRKTPPSYRVRGKSAAELMAEFNRSNPVNAEVCHGN